MTNIKQDFQNVMSKLLITAEQEGKPYVDIKSAYLHRIVGSYPGPSHFMPLCCSVMRKNMINGDKVLSEPPIGIGASLKIRYIFPRKAEFFNNKTLTPYENKPNLNNVRTNDKDRKIPQYPTKSRFKTIPANKNELLQNLNDYYNKSMLIDQEFGGPSIYFHIECIKAGKENYLGERYIEMLYATLASWGMHKMGDPKKTKAKLVNFNAFKDSILSFEKDIKKLKQSNLSDIEKSKDIIEKIFMKLNGLTPCFRH